MGFDHGTFCPLGSPDIQDLKCYTETANSHARQGNKEVTLNVTQPTITSTNTALFSNIAGPAPILKEPKTRSTVPQKHHLKIWSKLHPNGPITPPLKPHWTVIEPA